MDEQKTHGGYAMHAKRTIWNRLGFCTPHARHVDDIPDYAPGELITEATVTIDWWDRLRILVSGRAMVQTAIKTDVPVARSFAVSAFAVLPPA